MTRTTVLLAVLLVLASTARSLHHRFCVLADEDQPEAAVAVAPVTEEEARTRARILHETINGALQVMHRDFFNPAERLAIPSRSLEDVFKELARTWQVNVRWLVVNADAMNLDHQPQDDFEKEAAQELAAGKSEYEALEDGRYRYVGSIRLRSQCLKCHVARRTSTEDRFAGLVISMQVGAADAP